MTIEWVSGCVFGCIFLCYNGLYFYYSKNYPERTQKGRHNIYQKYWVENILKPHRSMIAVQQIRNTTTITSFLASSTLILMGVIVSFTRASFPIQHDYADYKLYALLGITAIAFFNFLLTLRTLSYITILIESSPSEIEELEGIPAVEYLTKKVNRAYMHDTLGMRCLYYSIPLFFWFYDPVVFVAVTIVVTAVIAKFLDF